MRAALAVALCLVAGRAAATEGLERADELFHEGNSAFAEGDLRGAYDAYRAAWSLRKSFDIACNLGRTEAELSLSRDAAEHLDYCLRTYPASSREDLRAANRRFRDLFIEVRARVAALQVSARKPGAEITVDGASYGTTPLSTEVFVDPGQHRVRASLAAFEPEERVVEVGAGDSIAVSFALSTPARSDVPPVVPVVASPAPSASSGGERASAEFRTTVAISGGALTLVGLGVGTAFLFDARSSSDRVERIGQAVRAGGGSCGSSAEPPDCASLRKAVDDENAARARANAVLVGSAIVGFATVAAWLIIPDDAKKSSTALSVTPAVGWGSAGVAVSGSY